MSIKEMVIGGVMTVVIGGTAYTVNQADVTNNFASDTGLTQQQAEEYVNGVKQEDLVSYDELGAGHITEGKTTLTMANDIDCDNYEYEWESSTLTCEAGKAQLNTAGNNEIALGEAYKKLHSDSATELDMTTTIQRIDTMNADYESELISKILDQAVIEEVKKTNSYNKALIKTALDSK